MKILKKIGTILLISSSLSIINACDDDDSCPEGTEEVRDLDGNLIDCAVD